ncbi:MAG: ion transporter [Clostridium sp.]|nr:ion transporter [Clostridium sp.]MCM1171379.1 ion transporter [Clostridium sp.]MCM1207736.1 ion transporter [Ruminococcus sp.]
MSRIEKIKRRTFDIIQIGNKTDFFSTLFDYVISVLIVVSIAVTFMQTFEELEFLHPVLFGIELVTIIIFLIEYCLRLWTACYLYEDVKPAKAMLKYMVSFYGIVDLLTIISFFVPAIFTNGFVALRMLRVVRIMRLFKLNEKYDAFNVITDVLKDKKDQIISSVFIIMVLLLASSMCMYSLEHEAQPENFQNGFSGIWWSVSTMLTVGYGDIYPITIGGRFMAIIISFLGVGIVAIPTGIISAGFVEHYTKVKTGSYSHKNSEFVVLDVPGGHSYVDKKINEIRLPEGLYLAVVLRGEDTLTPYPELVIRQYDNLLLASTSNRKVHSDIEEVKLNVNHPWIGKKIKELDISRQIFIIMIRRKERVIKPEGNTGLLEGDIIVLLDKR